MIFNDSGVQGADVSFYQDNNNTPQQINFPKMKHAGGEYVIIRAGQNLWVDPDFQYNWQEAKMAGLPRGAYWFYDSRADPEKQAILFASLFVNDAPELELWLDLEENYGGIYTGYTHWKRFLNKLRALLPQARIGIYTGYGYIKGKIPVAEWAYFMSFPLWLAWYTANPAYVIVPAPWTSCLYWQWGTPSWGIEWGCESIEIDMNLFNGTLENFRQRYNLGGEVPPPGEPMDYVELTPSVAGEYRSIRSETNYPAEPHIFGSTSLNNRIQPGNTAKANPQDFYVYEEDVLVNGLLRAKAGDKWWKVYEANGTPIIGWVAESHLGVRYLNTRLVQANPQESHVVEVTIDGVVVFRTELT